MAAAFGWSVNRGSVGTNPFAALPVVKSAAKRERVLSDLEMAEIWRAAGEASAPFGPIIRRPILTGQRRGEVAGMAWSEVSDDLTIGPCPRNERKTGRPRTCPERSGPQSFEIIFARGCWGALRERPTRISGHRRQPLCGVVESQSSTDKAIMAARAKAVKRGGKAPAPLPPWNVHDLRRTVATGLQRLGVRLEVTEAVLNHISGSRGGIAGVYQRHDWAAEKRAALDFWGLTLARLLGAVLPLPTS